jgi:RimJ/RimL family protein N-acetyltransferase
VRLLEFGRTQWDLMKELESDRLLLRQIQCDDLLDIMAWGTDHHDAQALIEFCKREYKTCGIGPWGIVLKEQNRLVGNCGFWRLNLDSKTADINYFVAPEYRGMELAPDAVRLVLEFSFSEIGLTCVRAQCELDNIQSLRVMQKVGMSFKGLIAGPQRTIERLYVAQPKLT